ncbi:MAG: aspartate carbamoyltransferase regulatory subunit [Candidatus Bathyarchaeota archaeon]|nr:MAG: aspartate carbamoyltransferase regulatory subunit [Candidatus Bathyarchaeota archaeon]
MAEKTLRVSKIKDGTVIDHVTSGHALDVVKLLGITGRAGGVVTVAMNVPSKDFGLKDMVKVEGRELSSKEVDKIALLAPHATINIVRDYTVVEKQRVKLPSVLRGILRCANPACVSNSNEPVQPTFYVKGEEPLRLKCHYCGYIMEKLDVLKQF